ncbi:MAG: hypothetical protein ACTHJ5_01160 [Ilyomonas sp.]
MKIQLPDFIIADLYKDTLVVTDDLLAKPVSQKQERKVTELQQKSVEIRNEEIEIKSEKGKIELKEKHEKFFLGENRKNITILVSDDQNVFLDDESLQLLSGILAACRLNIADAAIVNYYRNTFNYQHLKQSLQPKYLFMFDVLPQQIQLPFTMPQYQKQPYDNCIFLAVPSLNIMKKNTKEARVEKSKLWVCLKGIFDI